MVRKFVLQLYDISVQAGLIRLIYRVQEKISMCTKYFLVRCVANACIKLSLSLKLPRKTIIIIGVYGYIFLISSIRLTSKYISIILIVYILDQHVSDVSDY